MKISGRLAKQRKQISLKKSFRFKVKIKPMRKISVAEPTIWNMMSKLSPSDRKVEEAAAKKQTIND